MARLSGGVVGGENCCGGGNFCMKGDGRVWWRGGGRKEIIDLVGEVGEGDGGDNTGHR